MARHFLNLADAGGDAVAAMLNDALNNSLVHSAPGRRERWFDFCFRFIILVLAGLWLFVPPADKGRTQPDVKAAATQR